MGTIRKLLGAYSRPGEVEARHEAEILLGHALGRDRAWLFTHADDVPGADAVLRFRQLMQSRERGEPVAYLTGRRGFWTLDLAVTPDVLIPRPETELLVELALERIPVGSECEVADLGTGSGAIALAIASERPLARVLATDASAPALAVARENAERLDFNNVEFALGNWCAAMGARLFDVIVSNPPYIEADDIHLDQGDLRFEPQSALASGSDGLDAIRDIVGSASTHLGPGAWLLLEHGHDQGERVRAILESQGFSETRTWRDLAGKDRISGGQRA
ncbi:peptide chain release factor N(5)-glutamine methyltransferase [Dokdonella sp.]|uniref:peptide chain release factor N(5)-glutamine methyltransferase n=1 Tax=Dokdonella sp. TaxID=2291710 RepID=UPI003C6B6494